MAAPRRDESMPAEVRDVLNNLRIGSVDLGLAQPGPLAVSAAERAVAVDRVVALILDPPTRGPHFAYVRTLFGGDPVLHAVPWRIVDPYGRDASTDPDQALPKRALDAASTGPDGPLGWTPEELAYLLLDQDALTTFALLVHDLMPDWWIDALGREPAPDGATGGMGEEERDPFWEDYPAEESLEGEFALRNKGSDAELSRTGQAVWTIALDDATKARFAETAYGDAAEPFELRLHRLSDGRAELEMTPPPRKADVALPATFRTGEARTFVVPIPPEAKLPGATKDDIRPTTRSNPCEALPADAFSITAAELRSDGATFALVIRSAGH